MAYENKPLTGVLYKNDRKESDSHPDYKGTFYDDQLQERWFDCWINTSQNGTKYLKLSVGDVKQPRAGAAQANPAPASLDIAEDIPF